MIVDRYEADTAFSFAHSLRRNICHEIWRPVAYSFPPPSKLRAFSMASVHRRLPVQGRIDAELVAIALRVPGFSVPFRDLKGDAQRIRRTARARCCTARPMRRCRSRSMWSKPVSSATAAPSWSAAGCWQRRQLRAVRGRAAQQPGGHLRRCRPASGRGYPRSVQLGSRQLSRHHPAVLPDLRVSLQPDAAPAVGAPLFHHRLQSRRQSRHPERDPRTDAAERTAVPALARRAGNGCVRLHVRGVRVSSESHSRPSHHLVQVGRVPRRRRGHRQVPSGSRDQPRRQHARQRDVLQSPARSRDVRSRAPRGALPAVGRQRAGGRRTACFCAR